MALDILKQLFVVGDKKFQRPKKRKRTRKPCLTRGQRRMRQRLQRGPIKPKSEADKLTLESIARKRPRTVKRCAGGLYEPLPTKRRAGY